MRHTIGSRRRDWSIAIRLRRGLSAIWSYWPDAGPKNYKNVKLDATRCHAWRMGSASICKGTARRSRRASDR